jgi:hypothetical protein
MNPEEKPKGIIVEGIKHSLPLNVKSMEELEIRIKDCLADIPKTNDLSFVIKDMFKESIDLCCKPIRINFIKRNAYVTYKGIKIPTKGLHSKSKNKFINRRVFKNVTPVSVTTEDLGDYKMGVDIKLRYNA